MVNGQMPHSAPLTPNGHYKLAASNSKGLARYRFLLFESKNSVISHFSYAHPLEGME